MLRNSKIVHKSIPQRISYECPRQLDSYPWKEKSRKMGVSYTEILYGSNNNLKFDLKKKNYFFMSFKEVMIQFANNLKCKKMTL